MIASSPALFDARRSVSTRPISVESGVASVDRRLHGARWGPGVVGSGDATWPNNVSFGLRRLSPVLGRLAGLDRWQVRHRSVSERRRGRAPCGPKMDAETVVFPRCFRRKHSSRPAWSRVAPRQSAQRRLHGLLTDASDAAIHRGTCFRRKQTRRKGPSGAGAGPWPHCSRFTFRARKLSCRRWPLV